MHLFSTKSIAVWFACGCAVISVLISIPVLAQSSKTPAAQKSTTELITDLSSPKFALRKQATDSLGKSNLDIAPQLVELIMNGTPEQEWRATQVLMQIGLNGDEKTMAKVTRILLVLGQNGRTHLMDYASQSRESWKQHQVKLTLANIKKLGGTVTSTRAFTEFGPRIVVMEMDGRPVKPVPAKKIPESKITAKQESQEPKSLSEIEDEIKSILAAESADDLKVLRELKSIKTSSPRQARLDRSSVWVDGVQGVAIGHQVSFGKNWKGSNEDFELLLDLPNVASVNLEEVKISDKMFGVLDKLDANRFNITRCEFNSKTIREFARKHPNAYVYVLGKAFLGVRGPVTTIGSNSAGRNTAACEISEVLDKTAADKAGLRVGDKVTKVDDHEISSFQDLVFEIAGRKIGDTLMLTVDRDGKMEKLKLTLGDSADPKVVIDN